MNEQQARALLERLAARAVRHQDAAKHCTYPEAARVHEGWAAGLEEASAVLVELLDGPQAARAFWERLAGVPRRSVQEELPGAGVMQVRHLSEKAPSVEGAA